MAEPNSNAILTVTVQSQDLLSGQNFLVNTNPPPLIVPAVHNVNYGGYITVTSFTIVNFFTGLSPGCLFLYVRNVPTGGLAPLLVSFTPTAGAPQAVFLAQGGIFIIGNPTPSENPGTLLSQAGYNVNVAGEIAVMEYFWAS
jgi:hypothetical protein